MRVMLKYIFFSLLLLLLITGCNSSSNVNEDLFKFKDSYVGDNSVVENIVRQLPNGEYVEGFELETKEAPYGMILEYGDIEATMIDDAIKETAIYNATFIFALVKNAEWITFEFGKQTHTVTKKKLQGWYGKELSEFTNEDNLRNLIEEYLENENKVNQFFEK
ncbi:DUF4825 domain-containing protein [Virgibacillus necropolis]|uniref:DUF4825 domain-containing protein n=1 Tax=Virgibacillus necropolis TaxID=163877 RepID=UPI00384B22E1